MLQPGYSSFFPFPCCSEKIPRNRLLTVFIIPRKKVLLSREFCVFLVIAHSEVQNGIQWKNVFKVIFVLDWLKSFHKFFLSLNGLEQNSEYFFLLQNGSKRNSALFYLLRNGSVWNFERFRSAKQTEFRRVVHGIIFFSENGYPTLEHVCLF
jgi:hypothetical protein